MKRAEKKLTADKTRQAFHLTGERGWINDPNGCIYFQGKYHVFFQHHPYSTQWGPMHWGHAVSSDLVHWEHLPLALYPDREYDKDGCFSGTAVAVGDRLYLMYTGVKADGGGKAAHQVQCLAYSDDGVYFQKCERNPVIGSAQLPEGYSPFDFRDPKLIRHNNAYYCLAAARKIGGGGRVLVYRSDNLLDWTFCCDLFGSDPPNGDMIECPDCFVPHDLFICSLQFVTDGKAGNRNVHTSQYAVGKNKTLADMQPLDYGFDFYAPQTFYDGKDLWMIAWQQMWDRNIPTAKFGWAGGMTLPRKLEIRNGALWQTPCDLSAYYGESIVRQGKELSDALALRGDCYVLRLQAASAKDFRLTLKADNEHGTVLSYAQGAGLKLCRARSGEEIIGVEKDEDSLAQIRRMPLDADEIDVTMIVDRYSVEVFADGKTLSATVCAPMGADGISLSGELSDWKLTKHELQTE
ncbi:MAG: GH32 C-terminal domain-containing protein [Clostridiales bacterium]|nr:GH32 C-terminal domain-containing protein [Clostridiales bacterium]